MNIAEYLGKEETELGEVAPATFLLGLLSAFENKYQAKADSFLKELTWKQFFTIININLCSEAPSIMELSQQMGSSHQNVKQILLKLEKKGFVQMLKDPNDRRRQRVVLTDYCINFCNKNEAKSEEIVENLFKGIDEKKIKATIETILQMERNLEKI